MMPPTKHAVPPSSSSISRSGRTLRKNTFEKLQCPEKQAESCRDTQCKTKCDSHDETGTRSNNSSPGIQQWSAGGADQTRANSKPEQQTVTRSSPQMTRRSRWHHRVIGESMSAPYK